MKIIQALFRCSGYLLFSNSSDDLVEAIPEVQGMITPEYGILQMAK
jgi:hypothetical protein